MSEQLISCLQTAPQPTFELAIEEALKRAQQASRDSSFLLLPEYCSGFRVENGRFAPPAAPEATNPFLAAMQELAIQRNVWVMPGSMAIPVADSKGAATDKIFNRGFVIDNHGNIQARYNKIHLFDIQLNDKEVYKESDVVTPGDSLCIVDTPAGKTGFTICYDLRFPQLYRDLASRGAETLMIPAAFTRTTGEAHWHALCRARAIENGAFVVATCATGDIEGGGGCYGHSVVYDPWGNLLADAGDKPGVVDVELDLSLVQETRARIPSLQHDRFYALSDSDAQDNQDSRRPKVVA